MPQRSANRFPDVCTRAGDFASRFSALTTTDDSTSDCLSHCFAQFRDDGLFVPRMLAHPNETPPTRMWHREELRVVRGECLDSLRHGALAPPSQIMPLSVLTDQERHLKIGKVPEQALVPMRCALGARRHVALVVGGTGITESHRQDGNF